MPSYLDLGLIGVVLVSALLSTVRGFTREVLAIASWITAAAAAYYLHPLALPYVKPYISKDTMALAAAAGGVFLVTLVIVSLITVKLSDVILDSKIGALDRSLGFLFGAGRGYLLCVIAFVFFAWLVPEKAYPSWVQNSKTRGWLEATGQSIQSMLPENLDSDISRILKKGKDLAPAGDVGEDPDEKAVPPTEPAPVRPGRRTDIQPVTPAPVANRAQVQQPAGNAAADRQKLDALISGGKPAPAR